MNRKRGRYTITGAGVALGAALGLLFWVMTDNIIYMLIGANLGLIIGAVGYGFAQGQKRTPK